MRRGAADLDGHGEAVSGIVIMRHGENALEVIERVRARLHEIEQDCRWREGGAGRTTAPRSSGEQSTTCVDTHRDHDHRRRS
jgi:hypothetical protein